jgi:hypothetical protein
MDELIRETMAINEQESMYRHEVPVSIYSVGPDTLDIEDPDPVQLSFDIEMDHRSWGIKDINVTLKDTVSFNVTIGGVDVPIKIDFGAITPMIVWSEGSWYAPAELHVTLDAEHNVQDVEVDFYYLKP